MNVDKSYIEWNNSTILYLPKKQQVSLSELYNKRILWTYHHRKNFYRHLPMGMISIQQ